MNSYAVRWMIRVFLWAAIGVVLFYLAKSILEPVRFEREFQKRRTAVIGRLEDIRKVQKTYKDLYGHYAPDFRELKSFMINGEIPVVRVRADLSDTTFTRYIHDTLRMVNVLDSLFPGKTTSFADSLGLVPYSLGVTFTMETNEVEAGRVRVPVLEVSVACKDFLPDQDPALYDPESGLSIGSLFEPTLDGNWE